MQYVCPGCGEPAAGQSICGSCGTNLDALATLPTSEEFASGAVEREPERFSEENYGVGFAGAGQPGSLISRWGANLIDFLILVIAVLVVGVPLNAVSSGAAVAGVAVLYLFWLFAYEPILTTKNDGRTWGKQAMALRVRTVDDETPGYGLSLARYVVKTLLRLLVVVDPIVAILRPDRRSLHDLICKTKVETTG